MEFIFEKAHLLDIDEICRIIHRAIEKQTEEGIYQWDEIYPAKADFEEDVANGELYVLRHGKRITAFAAVHGSKTDFYIGENWQGADDKAAEIHRFCVNPECQNMGIGKSFLKMTEEMLKEQGFDTLRLDAFPENPYAMKLYRNTGYVEIGKVRLRRGIFLLMEKFI